MLEPVRDDVLKFEDLELCERYGVKNEGFSLATVLLTVTKISLPVTECWGGRTNVNAQLVLEQVTNRTSMCYVLTHYSFVLASMCTAIDTQLHYTMLKRIVSSVMGMREHALIEREHDLPVCVDSI